jgi:hypothetical protein
MGVFRQSAPGEIEINIPGIAESTVNKITRLARQGMQKGESESTDANGKKYPKGFTPPVDYYTDPSNINPDTGKPKEYGNSPLLNGVFRNSTNKKNKTDFTDYKNITINIDALRISSTYFDPNNINPATNKPVEFGNYPTFVGNTRTTNDARKSSREDFYTHKDYSGAQFKYILDYYFDSKEKTIGFSDDGNVPGDIYLASFLRTNDENEDPTMMSYDLIIDYENSPLFNGTIDKFIETFSFNKEISSRKRLLDDFKLQFFKFFKHNLPVSKNSPQFLTKDGVKTYYLKDLTGLNRLNESLDGTAESKQFIDYGKDFITLGLNEDVTQNMGYLSALYKNLAWSRVHGKHIIPENLLRFDLKISITEVRKFNRVYKEIQSGKNVLTGLADLISKYEYRLYECQMFFPNMPHGDVINMSAIALIEKYDFKFNYKHTNLKFIKFIPPENSNQRFTERIINNRRLNVNSYASDDANLFEMVFKEDEDDSQTNQTPGATASTTNPGIPKLLVIPTQPPKALSLKEKVKLGANKAFDTLKGELKNAVIRQANRTLTNAAALLNRTLNNIFNSLPIIGGIPPPKNVYEKPNVWEQAYIDFVGPGLRTFFENPTKFTTTGERKKLDQIVSEDPGIGNGTELGKYFSNDPDYGNAATGGKNKTLKQIVDDNPGIGTGAQLGKYFSNNPDYGNSATRGTNKTLKQIVDADPKLGNGFSGISTIPFLGNRANSTSRNRTLVELVLTSSVKKYGTVDWNDVQFPSQAQKYPPPITTGSKKLQEIVDADPNLGNGSPLLQGFFSSNPNYGNNATSGPNATLLNLVLNNSIIETLGAFEWGDIQFPSSSQKYPSPTTIGLNKLSDVVFNNSVAVNPNYGNNATPGMNNPLGVIVNDNSNALSPDYGNNATPGMNNPLGVTVEDNSTALSPDYGNNATPGVNELLDEIVEDNSDAFSPDYGNNATPGMNNPLGVTVEDNSDAFSPDYGNNATPGMNNPLGVTVEDNSTALSPDYGNNATEGPNNSINTIVENSSKTPNPSNANNATLGSNYTLEEYSKFSKSKVYGTVDWSNIQFPASAQKYPAPITGKI